MPTQLGEAQVPIRATTDKLDSDLARARGKVSGALKKLAGGLRTVGVGALGVGGAAIGAIAGIGAAIAKITIDAAPVEGIAAAFDGLADSAGIGGDTMLEALQKGSSGMISQRDLMLSFNKAAGLVSTDFATKLPDAMQYLSKVSASTGQDMGFLMDSLVVGVGRVSPMILDNLGIQVSLADATARAAEMFGVEAGALTKTQQQAGMMNVVLEKLAANTAEMPDVTESASAKLAQLRAGFEDTKAQIGAAFLPVLKAVLTVFGDLSDKYGPGLERMLETLGNAFGDLFSGIAEEGLFIGIENFLDTLGITPPTGLWDVLNDLIAIVNALKDGIAGFVDEGLFIGVENFLAALNIEPPAALWDLLNWFLVAKDKIASFISENVKLQDVFLALAVAIGIVVASVLGPLLGTIATAITAFIVVMGVVALIRSAWESDFAGIRTTVETALATIKQWWSEHGEEVKAKALEIWDTVKTTISEKFEAAKEIISNAIATIKEWWATHGDEIMAKATEIWKAVVATFEWFKGQFTKIFDAFRLAFEGDWRGFGEKLREYWDEAWAKIKEIGEKTWDAIKKFFTETDWGSVGKSILEGIAKGITAGLGFLKEAARSAARAALDAAKGFLGIASPSKLAALTIGQPFSEGIAIGIAKGTPEMMRAAEKASMMLAQAAERSRLGMAPRLRELVARPGTEAAGGGLGQVIIYNLTLEGVQDKRGLLAELQAMA